MSRKALVDFDKVGVEGGKMVKQEKNKRWKKNVFITLI